MVTPRCEDLSRAVVHLGLSARVGKRTCTADNDRSYCSGSTKYRPWDEATAATRAADADLVLLVGWALLHNQPDRLHLARVAVDAGKSLPPIPCRSRPLAPWRPE